MRKIRIAMFFIMIALGVVFGLIYGWIIKPVEYENTSPTMLRADYKADYVLMIAQVYQKDTDLKQAIQRLNLLDPRAPEQVCAEGLQTAMNLGYLPGDLQAINQLQMALQQPGSGTPVGGTPGSRTPGNVTPIDGTPPDVTPTSGGQP